GHGHPFERRSVSLVGDPARLDALRTELSRRDELRLETDASEESARRKLEVRAVEAVVIVRGSERRVLAASRAAIWGRGLAGLLHAELTETSIPERGYLHYLFPGLLCSSVMFAGLYGMGYAMARYRQNAFLKKLATTPLRRELFVLAQVLGRAVLVVVQVAMLLVCGLVAFSLPAPVGGMLSASISKIASGTPKNETALLRLRVTSKIRMRVRSHSAFMTDYPRPSRARRSSRRTLLPK
ncbi:MAG TPA: ABC transporter permease, partial [Polyangiaceae bacterium]|nr:ABC transporter permease [Polyangiaceae bacterium]